MFVNRISNFSYQGTRLLNSLSTASLKTKPSFVNLSFRPYLGDVPKRDFSVSPDANRKKWLKLEIMTLKERLVKVQALAQRATISGEKNNAKTKEKEILEKISALEFELNPPQSFSQNILSKVFTLFDSSPEQLVKKIFASPIDKDTILRSQSADDKEIIDQMINNAYKNKTNREKSNFLEKLLEEATYGGRLLRLDRQAFYSVIRQYRKNPSIIQDVLEGMSTFSLLEDTGWIEVMEEEQDLENVLLNFASKIPSYRIMQSDNDFLRKIKSQTVLRSVLRDLSDENPTWVLRESIWIEKIADNEFVEELIVRAIKKDLFKASLYPDWMKAIKDPKTLESILLTLVKESPDFYTANGFSWIKHVKDLRIVGNVFHALHYLETDQS